MAERSSFSDGGEIELLVLLPDHRAVTHTAQSNCPMMDLLIQIASKENLKPSAHVLEALASSVYDEDHSSKPTIHYKPNTAIGMLNTQVVRLAVKNSTSSKSIPANMPKQSQKINHSESFSNRVHNFNKMAGVSAVQICNDPDGFTKLSEDTKRVKSRSNFITSTLPPQVSGNWDTTKTLMNTFRLQIHLPYEQLHVIRASPEYTIQDILDIIQEERSLKMERYYVLKTNEPELSLDVKGTLKEYGITELTLKLRPEFEVIRNVNPKKVKKENSSHFRSAFKSFFHQLKPSSRSNSVTELRPTSEIVRPKSEIPRINNTEPPKPKAPPRKRAQAPPPPTQREHINTAAITSRSHTASESSCESMGEGSVGGSAPATLPRRCRLSPESASTTNLALEPPLPVLRRGVSDMAVNKPKLPRRKRLAPKPPAPISAEELLEDGSEEQAAAQRTESVINTVISSPTQNNMATEIGNTDETNHNDKIMIIPDDHFDRVDEYISVEINVTNEIPVCSENMNKIDRLPNEDHCVHENILLPEEKVEDSSTHMHKLILQNVEVHIEKQRTPNGHHVASSENSIVLNSVNGHTNEEITDGNTRDDRDDPVLNNIHRSDHIMNEQIQLNKERITHAENPPDEYQDEPVITKNESENKLNVQENNVAQMKMQNINEDVPIIKQITVEKPSIVEAVNTLDVSLKNALPASQLASYQRVESPVAVVVDKPEFKVTPMNSSPVSSVKFNRQSTPPLSKPFDNPRRTNALPQRSVSCDPTIASKPSVEQLLSQIQKIREKANHNQNRTTYEGSSEFKQTEDKTHFDNKIVQPPEIVAHIPKIHSTQMQLDLKDDTSNTVVLGSPANCITPPVSPASEDTPAVNGNNHTEEISSKLVTDAVTKLYSIERKVNSEPAKPRPLTKFMLTSWAEEKRPPVVNRIADYGSKNSSTLVRGMSETSAGVGATVVQKEAYDRPLPFSLSATLPRPFTKHVETSVPKPATVNNLPTIINVVEKTNPNKQMDHQTENSSGHINGRQSAYSKLNIFNMSPTILPEHVDPFVGNGNEETVNILTKPSWELVKDASRKLEEGKLNGDRRPSQDRGDVTLNSDVFSKKSDFSKNNLVSKNIEFFGKSKDALKVEKAMENGDKESVRHMYKYAKPLQFQLGTWSDKTKTLKIEAEGNLVSKSDPPLVTELDEVAVWSATY